MPGKNKTPLVGWHPRADLMEWLLAEVERRGGGPGVRSAILNEALSALRERTAVR
jgi:hypothetical protein